MILSIDSISACYGTKQVLHNLSLQAESGQIVVVVGRNGCSKTTLLKSVIGDVVLCQGTITLHTDDGHSLRVDQMSRRIRAHYVAMVEQQLPTAEMRVGEYVALGRTPYQKILGLQWSETDIKKVEEVLQLMNICQLKDRQMQELSGGEMQLCAIARMLVQDTPIVLLDEPMSSLDIVNQMEIASKIKHLKAMGKIVLCVVHDLNIAFSIADIVAIMKKGNLIACDTPHSEVLKQALNEAMDTEMNFFDVGSGMRSIIVPRKWNEIF